MIRRLLSTLSDRVSPWLALADAQVTIARLSRRLDELERRGARISASPTCQERAEAGEHHRCGACVYDATHGSEAEELRSGIEAELGRQTSRIPREALQHVLDRVSARDSLAHLIDQDKRTLTDDESGMLRATLHIYELRDSRSDRLVASGLRKLLGGER